MVIRHFWINRIKNAWEKRNIVWLSGVRRVGKTTIVKQIKDAQYFDCELPRVRRLLEDPEEFFDEHQNSILVFDEVHRLGNPSELLKVAADHFKHIKIVATGSSTLSASAKFKDTLTGRKVEIRLLPILYSELKSFKASTAKRMLYGGLPENLLLKNLPEYEWQEWIDSYWAKDIQELFRVEKRYSFQKFMELLFLQSGSMYDTTKFSKQCEISRATTNNYLSILEDTFVVQIVRPFSKKKSNEIVSAPKIYAFDTGAICYYNGWEKLRDRDRGFLWEHIVLNELNSNDRPLNIHYWRDKQQHEIDFVLPKRNGAIHTVECKWKSNLFDAHNLALFRVRYPVGKNIVASSDITTPYKRKIKGLDITFTGLESINTFLS